MIMKTKMNFYKNILGGLFISAVAGMTTACDPLGVEPTTTIDEDRYWQNPQLARTYVNNFYMIFSEFGSGHNFQSEQWSDNCQGNAEGDWATYRQSNFNYREYDAFNTIDGNIVNVDWTGHYKNIRSVYVGIERISTSTVLNEQTKNQLLGECHFFLAFAYFDLIKLRGVVPYVDRALNVTDNTFLPLEKREVLFDNILDNLDKSIKYFETANVPNTIGMVNKDVANGYKSRVALYAACAAEASKKNLHKSDLYTFEKDADYYYDLAYNAADDVKGYSLEPKYETLFTSETANTSKEAIWPVMFKEGQRTGFNPTEKNGPDDMYYGATEKFSAKWERRSGLFPTQDLVDAYLMQDTIDKKWKNWWETSQMQGLNVVMDADGEFTGEGADYREMFKNRDSRFYATVTYDGAYMGKNEPMYQIQTWIDDSRSNGDKPYKNLKYSALHTGMKYVDNIESIPEARGSSQTITSYYSRKYSQFNKYNENGTLNFSQRTTCYFNLRYAEILLNKAEASYKLGKTDYKNLINQIRERAGIGAYDGNDWWAEYKTQRRLEFAFECPGHRYWDLLRWGEADGKSTIDELNTPSRGLWISRKGVENDSIHRIGTPMEPGEEGYFIPKFKSYKMKAKVYNRVFDNARYYFMPYSNTLIHDYPQLKQNPGWETYNYKN